MQVDKCYFPSNLPRQAVSSPESGRESNMVRAEILYFLGSSVYRWGTSDSGFRPRQPVAVYTFRRGYPSFRGKNLPDPAQSSALSRSDQWHAVTASFLGWTLDAFDFFVLVFLMDTLAAHFHVDKSKIVETLFFTLVMRPVGALIFGLLADRYGRRKPLMANVVFFSVIELLCGFAPNYTVFLILRTIYGIGMGGEWGVGASLAMENLQLSRGPDDIDDVSCAWHAGFVPRLLEVGAWIQRSGRFLCGNFVQHSFGDRSDCVRAAL